MYKLYKEPQIYTHGGVYYASKCCKNPQGKYVGSGHLR